MSFPASLTTRTVKGRFVTYPGGVGAKGTVRIVLNDFMQGPTDDAFVVPFVINIKLDKTGSFSVILPATDDPQWTSSYFKVIINIDGIKVLRQILLVPYNSTDPIDVAEVFNIPTPTPGQSYILLASKGAPNGVASLDSNGRVPSIQLPPDSGGTGPITWDDVEDKPTTFPPATHTHPTSDVVGLDADLAAKADLVSGVVPTSQIPHIALVEFLGTTANQTEMLALSGQSGDYTIRTDLGQEYVITGSDPTQLSAWTGMPTGTSAVQTVNGQTGTVVLGKADIGLGNVTNTSDAAKPVSTAQQTALDLKANLASPTFTGTVSGISATMVGLSNVNNTSDTFKPVSVAQQTALDLKANIASPTFTGTVSGVSKSMVGLGNVDNTADNAKPVSTAQQTALDLKAPLASPTLTGTPAAPTATAGTNTTQLATTAFVTTADNLKAPLASPTFTGTVSGITAAMVGLGSVNNTADTAKPVSTAQQTALDLKANLTSPTLTGTPVAPTATAGTNTTQLATTAFVAAAIVANGPMILVLSAAASVPGGTPAGTIIFRTAT
jgi:hypothetical protein